MIEQIVSQKQRQESGISASKGGAQSSHKEYIKHVEIKEYSDHGKISPAYVSVVRERAYFSDIRSDQIVEYC